MTQSGKNHIYCKQLLNSTNGIYEYQRYNCNGLYYGRPYNNGERTPMSDSLWENHMCNKPVLTPDSPAVL